MIEVLSDILGLTSKSEFIETQFLIRYFFKRSFQHSKPRGLRLQILLIFRHIASDWFSSFRNIDNLFEFFKLPLINGWFLA